MTNILDTNLSFFKDKNFKGISQWVTGMVIRPKENSFKLTTALRNLKPLEYNFNYKGNACSADPPMAVH
jgi:hypothetical protein